MNKTAAWIVSAFVIASMGLAAVYFVVSSRPKVGKYSIFEDKIFEKTVVLDTETGRSWSFDGASWVELPRLESEPSPQEPDQSALIEKELEELRAKHEEEITSLKMSYEEAEKELKERIAKKEEEKKVVKVAPPQAPAARPARTAAQPQRTTRRPASRREEADTEAPEWLSTPRN